VVGVVGAAGAHATTTRESNANNVITNAVGRLNILTPPLTADAAAQDPIDSRIRV
jgi:hypothetical protein